MMDVGGSNSSELRAYEEQINNLQGKLLNSKRIVTEEQGKIKNAKKELLVLWKMEINSAVNKKKERLGLLSSGGNADSNGSRGVRGNALKRLKKVSRGKTCVYLNVK